MKLIKDGVIVVENNPNNVSVWMREGFVEYKEPKKTKSTK